MNDEKYMLIALEQAKLAYDLDEVPVGAIIVYNNDILAVAHNSNQRDHNPLMHAEIKVINEASNKLKSKDLSDCILYVTLEPCLMCTGAIINANIKKVVFGAFDIKQGTMISNQINDAKQINWVPGVLKEQCSKIISRYFLIKRGE